VLSAGDYKLNKPLIIGEFSSRIGGMNIANQYDAAYNKGFQVRVVKILYASFIYLKANNSYDHTITQGALGWQIVVSPNDNNQDTATNLYAGMKQLKGKSGIAIRIP